MHRMSLEIVHFYIWVTMADGGGNETGAFINDVLRGIETSSMLISDMGKITFNPCVGDSFTH